jgi:hypothetical protein
VQAKRLGRFTFSLYHLVIKHIMIVGSVALLSLRLCYPVPLRTDLPRVLVLEEMWFLGVLAIAWAFSFAYVGRNLEWASWTCFFAGLLFAPVTLLLVLGPFSRHQLILPLYALTILLPTLSGLLCRRLAYPHLTDQEANEPESPTTLFRK